MSVTSDLADFFLCVCLVTFKSFIFVWLHFKLDLEWSDWWGSPVWSSLEDTQNFAVVLGRGMSSVLQNVVRLSAHSQAVPWIFTNQSSVACFKTQEHLKGLHRSSYWCLFLCLRRRNPESTNSLGKLHSVYRDMHYRGCQSKAMRHNLLIIPCIIPEGSSAAN